MKLRLFFGLLILSIIGASCSQKKVFEQRHTFDQLKWNRFESIFFETDIKDITSTYSFTVELRHHTVYPFPNLAFTIAVYSPSGERRIKDLDVPLRNPDNTFKALGNGDMWDIDIPVFEKFSFNEPGHYKIELENRMPKFDTPGIIDIGLLIKKEDNKE